jgi:hypothetical protein
LFNLDPVRFPILLLQEEEEGLALTAEAVEVPVVQEVFFRTFRGH